MWSNLLRFVGEGITVRDLVAAVGLPKSQALSRLGGVERWRYVSVGPTRGGKREGYGSARGTKDDWLVRFTQDGERAASIWPDLPQVIEDRWRRRFGSASVDELIAALRDVDDDLGVALPEYLPVVSSTSGMALELPSVGERRTSAELPLVGLLAHALMAYTVEFEEASALSLPLSANVFRVLADEGTPVRDLPALTGLSKEAVTVSLTALGKTGYVVVEGAPASKRMTRLTPAGVKQQVENARLHASLEVRWKTRFGSALRASLAHVLDHPELGAGLRPHPGGWRASPPYRKHTEALIDDPRGTLPHYPMVLHRGGWPDGS